MLILATMGGKTRRTQVALYLDDETIELLNELKAKTGLDGQALIRRAINALLVRHKLLEPIKRRKAAPRGVSPPKSA
jgi:hypothetical protein